MTRPEHPTTIAVDTCTVLATINGQHHADTQTTVDRIIEAAAGGQVGLFASTMLLVEARGQSPKSEPYDPAREAEVLNRLVQPHWTYVELDRVVGLKARELGFRYPKLGNEDAVHLASAIVAGVEVFMTLDIDDYPVGTEVDNVWVDVPYPPGGDDLFTTTDR